MGESEDVFKISWDKVKIKIDDKSVDFPLLRVKISGDPSLAKFINIMRKIEDFIGDFEKDYISLTDFTDLVPNKVIESLVSASSSRLMRSIVFVSNQSKISFVLLGENSQLTVLKKKLTEINQGSKEKDYSYNYHFIEKESEIKGIAEKFFKNS